MERTKQLITFKTNKNVKLIEFKKIVDEDYKLEKNIQEHIDDNIGILDIVKKEVPNNDIKMQKLVHDIHSKLIWKIIENNNNENKILELWNKLRPYQKEYIEETIKKLLDNIKNHKKCIIKSPTGSGKTVMIYWIIAKLYKALGCPQKFNIILATPFKALCNQSITDEDNINILKTHNINANYLQYDGEQRKNTELELSKTNKQEQYINFISVCYPSMLNLLNFLEYDNIKINIAIYDEFHFIQSWDNPNNPRNKCFKNSNIEFMLFDSATPTKLQENKTETYGEVNDKIRIKELIRLKYLCPIVPLVEIDNINPKDPEEIKLQKIYGKYYKFPYMINEAFKTYNKKKAILFCNDTSNCWEMYDLLKSRNDVLKNVKIFHPYVGDRIIKKNNNKVNNNIKNDNIENDNIENDNIENDNIENNSDSNSDIDFIEEETIIKPKDKQNIKNILKEYENCLEPCILITCKKIAVGYNHPPIDFVILADNKSSITDISQAIGRGIRLCFLEGYENKICHVLLPLRIKDINSNNFKSIKSYLEYLQNDVGLNIESFIRKQINNQKTKVYSKYIKLNNKFDLTIEYDKLKFLNATWIQIYNNLNNLSNLKNIKQLEYDILYDLIKEMIFIHKDDYKKWAKDNNEKEYPETYFKNNGWINYYKFLNINIDIYPKTIEELKEKCISNNIKTKEEYENRMVELNMPSMINELYGKYLSFNNEEIIVNEIVNYLLEQELFKKILENSKIKKCKINNENINIFNYRPILINIYDKMDRESIIKNTKLNCKEEEIKCKGFLYYEKFNLSIQGADAHKTLSEIINMIKVNKWQIELQIELKKNNEIINFKI